MITAAAGEVGEGGDQRIVARVQRLAVHRVMGIAPPPAGEEPVTCHTANAMTVIAELILFTVFGVKLFVVLMMRMR